MTKPTLAYCNTEWNKQTLLNLYQWICLSCINSYINKMASVTASLHLYSLKQTCSFTLKLSRWVTTVSMSLIASLTSLDTLSRVHWPQEKVTPTFRPSIITLTEDLSRKRGSSSSLAPPTDTSLVMNFWRVLNYRYGTRRRREGRNEGEQLISQALEWGDDLTANGESCKLLSSLRPISKLDSLTDPAF